MNCKEDCHESMLYIAVMLCLVIALLIYFAVYGLPH
jgi:hypothetical protein